MRNSKTNFFLIPALPLLIACSSSANPQQQTTAAPPVSLSSSQASFPLALNNTWIFQATRYDGVPITEIMTTTLVITETVVEAKNVSSFFVARIHRDEGAEAPVVIPRARKDEPLRGAKSSEHWLVLYRNRIYSQQEKLALSLPSDASKLEFVFPLRLGDSWNLYGEGIPRQVKQIGEVIVPAGRFNNCVLFEDSWTGATSESWFCPGVGFVDEKSDHHGTPMGWRQVLVKYQIN